MNSKSRIIILFVILGGISAHAQNSGNSHEIEMFVHSGSAKLSGVLTEPTDNRYKTLIFIIAGSGPTDRDGNSSYAVNNHLKILSDSLLNRGHSTFRFDKRGIGKSTDSLMKEENLNFDIYIEDASVWIKKIREASKYEKIVILGHSEGSLIGEILSGRVKVSGFVSVNGTAKRADSLLLEQISKQSKPLMNEAKIILDSLGKGYLVKNINPYLKSLFRHSVQPYLISWIKYSPVAEIGKIRIPVDIIQGTNDLQISTEDANSLHNANKNSRLVYIEGMNHILKLPATDNISNYNSYKDPKLGVSTFLIKEIDYFIKSILK
jgi:uncharacterized protein